MEFIAPSKTFLLGEYSVLKGGPALLLTTPPYFGLKTGDVQKKLTLSEKSPAKKLYYDHKNFFSQRFFEFTDPHNSKGGLGASSAQFVLLARALGWTNPWKIWESYRNYAQQQGQTPSGADVIAQCVGGLGYVNIAQQKIQSLIWPFAHLMIALIHTGKKLATHEHLEHLMFQESEVLSAITAQGFHALQTKDQKRFLKSITDYAEQLAKYQWVADHTYILLEQLRQRPEILACKGCGAMGSDVVLAIIDAQAKTAFVQWATQEKLDVIYCDNQFATGAFG